MRTAALGALLLLTTACSGDDSADDDGREAEPEAEEGGDRDDYVTAFVDTYDNPYTTPEDRRCMAEASVEVLGVATLTAAGTPDELREAGRLQEFGITPDEATAGDLVDAIDACVDLRTVMFGDDEQLPPAVRSCLEARVPDDVLRRLMISTYTSATGLSDEPELDAQVNAGYAECQSQGTTTTPP
jgi:hypothetical protein